MSAATEHVIDDEAAARLRQVFDALFGPSRPDAAAIATRLIDRGCPPALAVRVALTPTFRHQFGGDDR